jgi:hypothetical protein
VVGRRPRTTERTQAQLAWMFVAGFVGAILATCGGVIVLAIIIGLADGH